MQDLEVKVNPGVRIPEGRVIGPFDTLPFIRDGEVEADVLASDFL